MWSKIKLLFQVERWCWDLNPGLPKPEFRQVGDHTDICQHHRRTNYITGRSVSESPEHTLLTSHYPQIPISMAVVRAPQSQLIYFLTYRRLFVGHHPAQG